MQRASTATTGSEALETLTTPVPWKGRALVRAPRADPGASRGLPVLSALVLRGSRRQWVVWVSSLFPVVASRGLPVPAAFVTRGSR